SPGSYTYYARYLLSHSRADEARALLQRALELSPNDQYVRELLKEAQTRASELALVPLAVAEIDQPLNKAAPQTPQPNLALRLQFYREERYIEAIFACRRALDLRPDYAEAWN